jgi:hypothetical protein
MREAQAKKQKYFAKLPSQMPSSLSENTLGIFILNAFFFFVLLLVIWGAAVFFGHRTTRASSSTCAIANGNRGEPSRLRLAKAPIYVHYSARELYCQFRAASYRSVDRIVGLPNVDRREQR